MSREAMFAGLVYDEAENLVETTHIGDEAHYVVDDAGFRRHINAENIDREILSLFIEQLEGHHDIASEQILRMLGKDDLFTKVAVDASLRNVNVDEIIKQGVPAQTRHMLGMVGFRVYINYHGEIVKIDQPAAPDIDE